MSWQQSIKIYWPLFSIHYNLCGVIKGHLAAPLHNLNQLHIWVEGESDINGSKIPISLQYTHTKISKTLFLEFHILFSFYFTLELSPEIGFGALFLQNFWGPGLVRIRKWFLLFVCLSVSRTWSKFGVQWKQMTTGKLFPISEKSFWKISYGGTRPT